MTNQTVYYVTNRVVDGSYYNPASYTADIEPPSDEKGRTGAAFISGIDVATNNYGKIEQIQSSSEDDVINSNRDLFIFIPGFDNSFTDAITRCAANAVWLSNGKLDLTAVVFSWPSLGQLIGPPLPWSDYKRDQVMAEHSAYHIAAFFQGLLPAIQATKKAGKKVMLLAHSMGNLALQAGVESWFLHGFGNIKLFDDVVLAAPDIGYDAFDYAPPARLANLAKLTDRITVYYSLKDEVLRLSQVINGVQRLGEAGPRDMDEGTKFMSSMYDFVDCSDVKDYDYSFQNSHQYYRLSPIVRNDIVRVFASGVMV